METKWKVSAPRQAPRAATHLRVAAVQMRSGPDLARNARRIVSALTTCARRRVAVVAFPECALTSYEADVVRSLASHALSEAAAEIARACGSLQIAALVGTIERVGRKWLNAALVIDRRGRIKTRYHKQYVVGADRKWGCMAGDQAPPVFRLGRTRCSVTICHDNRYPELYRLPVLVGAQVMFHLSHEGNLTKHWKLGPSRAQMQARAVENNIFVVHANAPSDGGARGSHGESRIIAPDGNLLIEASQREEEIVVADLELALATRRFALNSLSGPHRRWWREGMRNVPVIR
jgi:predicted amidohydrolase